MKNIIFIAVLLTSFSANTPLCAQKNVPQVVQTTFKAMFADAKKVKYSKETDGSFEVDFKQNNIKSSVHISAKGDWLETEQEIKKTDLPKVVLERITQLYPEWKIKSCEKVKMLDAVTGTFTFYEVLVKKSGESMELKWTKDGNSIELTGTPKQEQKGEK